MKPNKPEIIPYYKYKKQAFWKFNNALASLIDRNRNMSDPFGGRINNKTRFDFVIYLRDGNLTTTSVRLSLFPVGFLHQRKLSNGSLRWVFVKPSIKDSSKEDLLLLDQATDEALSEFLRAMCKFPTKASKSDLNYVSITIWHDYLNYSITQSDGTKLEFKTSLE
jgi:hypothetical protein